MRLGGGREVFLGEALLPPRVLERLPKAFLSASLSGPSTDRRVRGRLILLSSAMVSKRDSANAAFLSVRFSLNRTGGLLAVVLSLMLFILLVVNARAVPRILSLPIAVAMVGGLLASTSQTSARRLVVADALIILGAFFGLLAGVGILYVPSVMLITGELLRRLARKPLQG